MATEIPRSPIHIDQLGIGTAIHRYKWAVPVNQREYFWREEEVVRLFQDFGESINANEDTYFLGTVVTIPKGLDGYEVIDGQQRLATSTILLRAIGAYLISIGEATMGSKVLGQIKGAGASRRDPDVCRLSLNKLDNALFQRIIEGQDLPDNPVYLSHRKLIAADGLAQKHVMDIVAPHAQRIHADVLETWLDFIEHRAVIAILTVTDRSRAFKMFETLNDRGIRVGQADLIKSYLYSKCEDRHAECEASWDAMRGILTTIDGKDDITVSFIRHALIIMHGFVREKDIYDKVQAVVTTEQRACEFAEQLQQLSYEYAAIFNPNHEKWASYPDTVDKAITTLNLFTLQPLNPLLLAISLRFERKELIAAFDACVDWTVRLVVASSIRSATIESPLYTCAADVYSKKITTAAGLRTKLMEDEFIPNDVQFKAAFATGSSSNPSIAAYYLRELEASRIKENDPYYVMTDDKEKVNLEHVMPIKPDASWKVSPEIHKAYVRRIGNLCLLGKRKNSDLKNTSFEEKKKVYEEVPYGLTSDIAKYDEWGAAIIDLRQLELARLAVKTWPM